MSLCAGCRAGPFTFPVNAAAAPRPRQRKCGMAASSDSGSYSIWLMPAEDSDVCSRLKKEMACLQQRASGVPFLPHVTLVGGVVLTEAEMIARARSLAADLQVCLLPAQSLLQLSCVSCPLMFGHKVDLRTSIWLQQGLLNIL
jgi:hypothetical protein